MKPPFTWAAAGVLAFATATRAGDDVLVPGDPPLTAAVADRKIDYWEWVFAVRFDDRQRAEVRKIQIDEWTRGEKQWKERWANFLAVWQDAAGGADAARLRGASRHAALEALARGEGDAIGRALFARQPAPAAPAVGTVARRETEEALRMAALRMQFDRRQQFLRDLSAVQAQHHETMMVIIRNIKPSGRYEYNPATGRYDRYVPNP
jgi:hypothetical protein